MKKTLWAALLAAGTMVSAAVDAEPLRIGVLPAADAIVIHAAADEKLFKEIAPGYAERNGGYTRIVRTGVRRGDAAETAMIELV